MDHGVGCQPFRDVLVVGRRPTFVRAAPGAATLQVYALLALDQVAFAADDPQFVLVGRGQVDRPRGDGGAQVTGVWDIQVCI